MWFELRPTRTIFEKNLKSLLRLKSNNTAELIHHLWLNRKKSSAAILMFCLSAKALSVSSLSNVTLLLIYTENITVTYT